MPTERRLASRLQRGSMTRRLVYALGRRRALEIMAQVAPLLEGRSILDIGPGTCNMAEVLCEQGFEVTPLDLADYSFVDGLRPITYDGHRIPFPDERFDIALLGAVLHHVPEQEALLSEARRTASRVLVIEDLHDGRLQRHASSTIDSLLSLELTFPRHRYRSEAEWRTLFGELGLEVRDARRWRSVGGLFRHVAFLLERSQRRPNR